MLRTNASVCRADPLETAEQMAFLTTHQCEEAQGYLISRPLSAGEFANLFIAPAATSVQL
jgi:EAL domain-containing protein (putative c-di-GMP-specific phosphodiesterase class I)